MKRQQQEVSHHRGQVASGLLRMTSAPERMSISCKARPHTKNMWSWHRHGGRPAAEGQGGGDRALR
eukprot:10592393-Heterocapsa_arctica.AAC.1